MLRREDLTFLRGGGWSGVRTQVITLGSLLWYGALCHAMLWYGVLCHAMLWYGALCHAMICYDISCSWTFPAVEYLALIGEDNMA